MLFKFKLYLPEAIVGGVACPFYVSLSLALHSRIAEDDTLAHAVGVFA
jgi:hypothetical protein